MTTEDAVGMVARIRVAFEDRGGHALADVETRRLWRGPLESMEVVDAEAALERMSARGRSLPTPQEFATEGAAAARRRKDSEETLPPSPEVLATSRAGLAMARAAIGGKARG